LCCFIYFTGAVRDFYSVETSVIRTTIGIKLNNSAKQANKAKEGGREEIGVKEDGRGMKDGGAATAKANTGPLPQDNGLPELN